MFMSIVFNYMPSNIDIITPERINLTNSDLNDLFNTLAQKLHRYDEIAKTVLMERKKLAKKLKEKKKEDSEE